MDPKAETPICIRCLVVRYFLISVGGLALLAAIAGRDFAVMKGLTPLKIAIGMMIFGCIMAGLRITFFFLGRKSQD